MILDGLLQFDPNGTLASTIGANTPSTNVLDLLNARDMGLGNQMRIFIAISTSFTAAGAATLNIQFQTSVDNVTWTTVDETAPMAVATLVQGFVYNVDLNALAPGQVRPRYLRLNYQIATGPFTAGAFGANMTHERQAVVYYPPGITVLN